MRGKPIIKTPAEVLSEPAEEHSTEYKATVHSVSQIWIGRVRKVSREVRRSSLIVAGCYWIHDKCRQRIAPTKTGPKDIVKG